MDKRALIFIISISAALFFVNQWFSSDQKKSAVVSSTQSESPVASTSSTEGSPTPAAAKE